MRTGGYNGIALIHEAKQRNFSIYTVLRHRGDKYTNLDFKDNWDVDQVYLRADKIDGDDITINFNHPLAGSDVSFQVKILQKQ